MMRARSIALLLASGLLAACGDGGVGETRAWMKQVEKQTVPKVKALPEPKTFEPYGYDAREAPDPFDQAKLLGEMARAAQAGNANQPDLERPKEVLENFPLDTMRMVGTIEKGGVKYALLQVERTLYRVRPGQRIGQNFGRITRVSEGAIEIRESVQDATGDWVERMAHIELQHRTAAK
ncbi:pilus assembly protein PilP [Telluria beijingensis]|uniref:pilus assembly protein PilP n=1 Tax=Telluria beijingensis TaxID=3068633 RepID=UPI00279579F9|nr:pilus assembly protein PilP [Massilia sp. REN29]